MAKSKTPVSPQKMRRVISNRLSAKKSRDRRSQYLADLELKIKTIENQIASIQPQITSYKNKKITLLMDREKMDHQMTILHEETSLKDVEIEKHRAELDKLREILNMQEQWKEQMLNWNAGVQPMPNPLASTYYSNAYQAPTQNQMWIPGGVVDEHAMSLNILNNMGSMDWMNNTNKNAMNPNSDHYFP